jgi:hypothetical protein
VIERPNRVETWIVVVLWVAIITWAATCRGAPPTWTATTDGKTITLTPNTPTDIRITTTNGTSTASVLAAYVESGLPKLGDFSLQITTNGQPVPPQPPGPTPPPQPPALTLAGAVIVDETGTLTPAQSKLEKQVEAYARSKKLIYRCVDKDVKDQTGKQPPDLVPYLTKAAGKKLPYLILFDKGSPAVVLWEGVLDASAITELQKRGG